MQEAIVKTKKWGNSIGVILPAGAVNAENINPGEELVIRFEKKHNVLKEMFGALKFKKPVKDAIKETRREMESKWMQ